MLFVFFFKQKTAYEMRISDWSSDVCSSDLVVQYLKGQGGGLLYVDGARLGGIEPGPPCSLGNRDVQPAHMIDQAELARRCARPDATLPDFVHARGRHIAGNGHAGEEAAVYNLDRNIHELLALRGTDVDPGVLGVWDRGG